ncbi:MAG: beta-N-acetylhexosaminidase [Burkholderiales bacterium RIFCSPLOWO2_12_67_14]|nr:MAG: beta-N-acetylhexosaminidase [Burkholderiales bacterium RIFCSPLOWO2_02_FULL_67_64]OGB48441.1 MAG: beta-N-acetylhexosaminidase [Burkholderiales bacterium RIFCSPLOWO2_12_67_14]OGB48881.1 MAG: beta-N-acetylhexosaminidase [Burkholderiales bacterium RIFCSPHIGHO2_12_FULL_67_38]OGB79130.1 MAG: beta-N-acetylhexosaminidase [Burkholderiales bacterium RIFCSPLOWO2_12_FULL_67_210]
MHQHAPLIIDVAGHGLTTAERRRLAHPLVGGVILFSRNWQDRAQLTKLCRQIKTVRPDLLIAVDHEGGRVQRFRSDGFTHLPPMAAFGALWGQPGRLGDMEGSSALRACNAATAAGYVLGAELRACGVDLSFTPVLDLDYGESSVIGDRAFARDPRVVTLLAQALMLGLQQSGMGNCGKHFPGHGFVKADSHLAIPVDQRGLKAILAEDAAPYGWLSSGLQAVMPAHVIYSKVDSRPAGFSPRWLQEVLRRQLHFTGAIFSDDLSMAAARQIDGREVSFAEAALAALSAGGDMVVLCNQSVVDGGAPIDTAIDALSRAVIEGRWQPNPASEDRRLALLPRAAALEWDALMVSERYMQALSLLP